VISKRSDSCYEQRRSRNWVKSKCIKRQEFVIGGFTDPGGSRVGFGALLLGVHDGPNRLVYCGKVGTGFTDQSLRDLHKRLAAIEQDKPPFINPPRGSEARGVHWVRPGLVGEVEFIEWTSDGILRHPSFHGLRQDKKSSEIVRETPQAVESGDPGKRKRRTPRQSPSSARTSAHGSGERAPARRSGPDTVAGVPLTNPDRLLYPERNITKRELAEYYAGIADWVLAHVAGRPLSIVRCPQGRQSKCFYQKHVSESLGPPIRGVKIRAKEGSSEYLWINDLAGLITLAQLGALEFHPWGSRTDNIEKPDRLIFDLDPGPGVKWSDVIEAARLVRDRLEGLGLQSFVKTTGGKGLHVVAPVTRRAGWDEVKDFARRIVRRVSEEHPGKYLIQMTKAKRRERIFLDYLRNGRGATAVAAYSTRARAGAPVSTPLKWEELSQIRSADQFTLRDIPGRLARLKKDPWEAFFTLRQSVTASMLKHA
jgi:bifunctional non-homologous end joining protein LigD